METFVRKKNKLTIRVPKELDHHHAEFLRQETDRRLRDGKLRTLEFDFRDTDFMDSSGIGLIMGRFQNIRLLGGEVRATHVNERIFRLLQLAGVHKVIEIEQEKTWNQVF